MPIEFIWDEESVNCTYINENGKEHHLPEILGYFENELDAELTAIEAASDLMSGEEFKELTRKAYQRDYMRQMARKRWEKTPEKEKKEFFKKLSKSGNKAQGKRH
jgi:hypothetical protein